GRALSYISGPLCRAAMLCRARPNLCRPVSRHRRGTFAHCLHGLRSRWACSAAGVIIAKAESGVPTKETVMATVQTPANRPAPVSKHEAFAESQLRRALGRVRTFDITAGVFGFLVITSIYALAVILLDLALFLPSLIRLALFG